MISCLMQDFTERTSRLYDDGIITGNECLYMLSRYIEEHQNTVTEVEYNVIVNRFKLAFNVSTEREIDPPDRSWFFRETKTPEDSKTNKKIIPNPEPEITYAQYLQTEHWQKTRKKALRRAKRKCQLCSNSENTLHVHHNNYENLGNEDNADLVVLCDKCHAAYHGK